jgi:hypothetical protein
MQNKTIGKLLAKENITIQHGNYHTAWFDIQNRTLGLPQWADHGKDVYDLLIGHEVGHALFTPFEGWHDSPEKLKGCPRSYINVIEDARIEKLVRRAYPGLVGPFLRGYKKLSADNFFGDLDKLKMQQVKLIDKINLKAKLGKEIDIRFNTLEQALFDRAMLTETFEEVVELVKDVLAYTKENQKELMDQPALLPNVEPSLLPKGNDDIPKGHDDMDSEEASPQEETSSTQNEEEENSSTQEAKENEEAKEDKNNIVSKEPIHNDHEDTSITDTIFRENESGLVAKDHLGHEVLYSSGISKELINEIVIDYKTLAKDRLYQTKLNNNKSLENRNLEFKQYMKDTRKNVNFAIKEFEMRKAAHQWQRATTAKTGSLDVNKVHSYKYNEDIFARVTSLADAKNHGMIMIIDYSGSMCESMPYVLDQLMHLIVFCKAVNIPFEVYAFTTGNPNFVNWHHREDDDVERKAFIESHNTIVNNNIKKFKDASLSIDDLSMPLLVSSNLKKNEYITAMANLHCKIKSSTWNSGFTSQYEQWGSTPLNAALVVSHHLIKKFKMKHGVEKMNFVCLSDGDTNQMHVIHDHKLTSKRTETNSWGRSGLNITIDGKNIKTSDSSKGATKELLLNIQKRYNTNTLGFFMADDNRHFYNRIQSAVMDSEKSQFIDYYSQEWKDLKKNSNTEFRKNKCVVKNNVLGYNEYYIIKGGATLSAQGDEPMSDLNDDSSTAQVRNAFKKQAKSKKTNKVLLTRFGKAVA